MNESAKTQNSTRNRHTSFGSVDWNAEDASRYRIDDLEESNDPGCRNSRPELAPADAKWPPAIAWIADAWPHLKPHIRDAITTLIDAALSPNGREGGSHE